MAVGNSAPTPDAVRSSARRPAPSSPTAPRCARLATFATLGSAKAVAATTPRAARLGVGSASQAIFRASAEPGPCNALIASPRAEPATRRRRCVRPALPTAPASGAAQRTAAAASATARRAPSARTRRAQSATTKGRVSAPHRVRPSATTRPPVRARVATSWETRTTAVAATSSARGFEVHQRAVRMPSWVAILCEQGQDETRRLHQPGNGRQALRQLYQRVPWYDVHRGCLRRLSQRQEGVHLADPRLLRPGHRRQQLWQVQQQMPTWRHLRSRQVQLPHWANLMQRQMRRHQYRRRQLRRVWAEVPERCQLRWRSVSMPCGNDLLRRHLHQHRCRPEPLRQVQHGVSELLLQRRKVPITR